jgi:hypothetical protein
VGQVCNRPGGLGRLQTCPTGPAVSLPEQVGGFLIRGVVRWEGNDRVLLGEDPALERHVWLRLRPLSADPLPATRKELARSARLRWLAEGEWGEWRWDAFVAPTGFPFADVIAAGGGLDWAAVRGLLEQLADELDTAAAAGTLPDVLTLEQVHVPSPGRVALLDGPPAPGAAGPTDRNALALLRQVAVAALAGAAGPPPRVPLPVHARALLRRLTGESAPYERVSELRADLAATRDRPAEVTPVLRALHLALGSSFLALGLLVMLVWIRFGNVSEIMILDRMVTQTRALRHVLQDEATREAFLAELPENHPLRRGPAAWPQLVEDRLALDRQEMQARVRGLGPFDSIFMLVPVIRLHRDLDGGDEEVRFEPVAGKPLAVVVVRPALAKDPVAEVGNVFVGRRQLRQAADRLEVAPDRDPARPVGRLVLSGLILLGLFPTLWVVWAFLFRGGLSLRVAGLALVRGDGRDALRLQCAWRALLVWAPVVAFLVLAVWVDVAFPTLCWLGSVFQVLFPLVLLGFALLALRFPARGLHDRLAGTYLVPR